MFYFCSALKFRYICTMGILRKTKSVTLILDEFEGQSTAISAISLTERLHLKMNKTTIYRILDKLEDDGFLHSFLGKNGHKWYAKCSGCSSNEHHDIHPHFQCLDCEKVDCLSTDIIIPNIPNRKINVSQILLQGTCEDCFN